MTEDLNLEQQVQELSVLHTIAAALNTEADLAKVLSTVLETIAQVTPVDTGWVYLRRETSGEFYLAASYNLPPALTDYPERMYGDCTCLDMFEKGKLDKTEHYSHITCSRLKNLTEGTRGLRFHASAPLRRSGQQFGVMNLTFKDLKPWSVSQLRLVNTIADMVSVAIERARLFDKSVALGAAEERNRIARDIHDTIAQGIAGIALRIETADALLESNAPVDRIREALAQALELTRANMEEARRSVLDLRAVPLEGRNLAEAIQHVAENQGESAGLCVNFKSIGESLPLPPRIEMGLFRIAQEAINNVIKHAQAEHLSVVLVAMPDEITLTIDDDGNGVSESQASNGRFGMIGMTERARLLGGSLNVDINEAGGTQVQVVVPLELPDLKDNQRHKDDRKNG